MKHERRSLFQVWKEAFNEDDSYIEFFLKEGSHLGRSLTFGPSDTNAYACLTLFPITFEMGGVSYLGYYLYALGSLCSQRGKGYGKALLRNAEVYALETDRQFILLQPTNDSLFQYYSKSGYRSPVCRSCIQYTRAALLAMLPSGQQCLAPLSDPQYFSSMLPIEQQDLAKPTDGILHFSNLTEAQLPSPKPAEGHLLLSELSAPVGDNSLDFMQESEPSFDRFVWPQPMREYIRKECLFRGGGVINGAYCYPNSDAEGSFLEIKEFHASPTEIPALLQEILLAFPYMNRFYFYGKPHSTNDLPLCSETFALIRFLTPELEARYNPRHSYFALGID